MSYNRENYIKHRDIYLKRSKFWQKKNWEHVYKIHKIWRDKNKDKIRGYAIKYWREHRLEKLEYEKKRYRKLRFEALCIYGGNPPKCTCCKEKHIEFLAIDHIKGGGSKHRKKIRTIYDWLHKMKYPKGFRVLCHNCNSSIGFYKYCPHEME